MCIVWAVPDFFVCLVERVTGWDPVISHTIIFPNRSLSPAKRFIGQLEINLVRLSTHI